MDRPLALGPRARVVLLAVTASAAVTGLLILIAALRGNLGVGLLCVGLL